MHNRLATQSSPYLLQHCQQPVDWFSWCEEAFEEAAAKDKPIFLSIGYSTCHWCHVMAHESFEDQEIADILNNYFISVKVDREERPDIDSVYMPICQSFTGSGGWPMSIFMTAQQKPFFAGTYFPPVSRQGMIGFKELLLAIAKQWRERKSSLLATADQIIDAVRKEQQSADQNSYEDRIPDQTAWHLPAHAAHLFSQSFDAVRGGFGNAPKFPLAHNLVFLLLYAKLSNDQTAAHQALFTLKQMRKGGIFDQIGYGFSRYSTDAHYLVPHFEKMLYDNALLILAYAAAYKSSGDTFFLETAEQTADYIFREMTNDDGAFFSAQDADSEGEEGRYYTWNYEEIQRVLGAERGSTFCSHYGITKAGNFEGKNIPNLLQTDRPSIDSAFASERKRLYEYRKTRASLHLDDKILTSWNALMICAMTVLYRVSGKPQYLTAAVRAQSFIEKRLTDGNLLYVSCRSNTRSVLGFLDDYAYEILALLSLYDVTSSCTYLERAKALCQEALAQFADKRGGYYLYGANNDALISCPKESYDGALPSGNSTLALCFVRLSQLAQDPLYTKAAKKQLAYLAKESAHYPAGYSVFLTALLFHTNPPEKITIVLSSEDTAGKVLPLMPLYADLTILEHETGSYKLLNGKTTYYVCKNHTCLPPVNTLD